MANEHDGGGSSIDSFDRHLGALDGLPGVLQTKQSTVQSVTPLIGKAETFIVQTVRLPEHGDTIFLQCLSAERSFRLVIPPKVSEVIARQRDSLSARSRSKTAKAVAADRKAQGIPQGFQAMSPERRREVLSKARKARKAKRDRKQRALPEAG